MASCVEVQYSTMIFNRWVFDGFFHSLALNAPTIGTRVFLRHLPIPKVSGGVGVSVA